MGPAMPNYRIEMQLVIFTEGDHISPQRMEDEIISLIRNHKAFGYVKNVYVTRQEEENDSQD